MAHPTNSHTDSLKKRLRVALIGSGARSANVYIPIVKALSDEIELVAVWSRGSESADKLVAAAGVPAFTDVGKLVAETSPDIGIVSVRQPANGEVGLMTVEAGMHALLETPIAQNLEEADKIISASEARGVYVEIAEQFHRRPVEQLKLRLIQSGLFGQVHTAIIDGAGYAYHGVSVMRSYLGFDAVPRRVVAMQGTFPMAPSHVEVQREAHSRTELQQYGIVQFDDGRLGLYLWSDPGFMSPLRWWKGFRFLAEKGMGITVRTPTSVEEHWTLLQSDGAMPRPIVVHRRLERMDGGALMGLEAHTGDAELPIVRWENPFRRTGPGETLQWHDDEIGIASCLMSLINAVRTGKPPSYGPRQARLDQEVALAIRKSAESRGAPVDLPLAEQA